MPHKSIIPKEISLKLQLLSFVAVVLVVCIHLPMTRDPGFSLFFETLIGSKIALSAVPFFFCSSGYLLASGINSGVRGYYSEVKKRVWSLLLPYLIWCLMLGFQSSFHTIIMGVWHGRPVSSILSELDVDFLQIFGFCLTTNPPMPLWFVRALMIYVLLSPLFLFIAKSRRMMIVLVCVLVILHCVKNLFIPEGLSILFNFTLAPINILAFMCGMRFSKYPVYIPSAIGKILLVFGVTVFTLMSYLVCHRVSLHSTVQSILSILGICSLLAGAWSSCHAIDMPVLFRKQTFPIYLLHVFLSPYVFYLVVKLIGFRFMISWVGFLLNIVVFVMGSIAVSLMMHKFLPKASNLIFGGR